MSKKGPTNWPLEGDFGRRRGNLGRRQWEQCREATKRLVEVRGKGKEQGGASLGGKGAQEGGQWGILIDALGRGGVLRL